VAALAGPSEHIAPPVNRFSRTQENAMPSQESQKTTPAAAPSAGPPLEGKRVLIAIGEFAEGMETYYLVYRVMEEGIIPVVAAPNAKRLQLVVHDFEPAYEGYTEKLGYQIEAQSAYRDIRPEDYDGLLLPGGRAPEEIRQNEDLLKIVSHFLDQQRPVGAMCHGVMLLYSARSIKGRRLTAYPGIRRDVELLGGQYIDEPVVVDGPLVTSRGWPDLPHFMPRFLQVLAGQ
jgi:protease I